MGGICGVVGSVASGLSNAMAEAMWRRGQPVYARDTAICAVRQIGSPSRSWCGDISHRGREFVVAFDGDLFNAAELSRGLKHADQRTDPRNNAELLVALYVAFGTKFLSMLDGPFALVLSEGEHVLLARDRLGVKPLFYHQTDERLLFGSEIKSLVCALEQPPSLDGESLCELFVFGDHMLGNSTPFCGIKHLRPGSFIAAKRDASGITVEQFDYAEADTGPELEVLSECDEKTLARQIRSTVERNVERLLAGAEQPGILLSGGFDSSVLAVLARNCVGNRLRTFTISDDPDFPDVIAARKVADYLGTDHHELILSDHAGRDGLAREIHAYEDLTTRSTIFRLARHVAGKADLVLSGAGADLLGLPLLRRGRRLHQALANRSALASSLDRAPPRLSRNFLAIFESLAANEDEAIQRHFLHDYLPNQLFPSTERAMQYFGVDVGFPFASNLMFDTARSLPRRLQERDGLEKPLLRMAFADIELPDWIKARPTLCSKQNLARTKRGLADFIAARPGVAARDSVSEAFRPLPITRFSETKFAIFHEIFIDARGKLGVEAEPKVPI